MYDVYLYGMVSPSTVYVLDPAHNYPKANEYAEIKQVLPSVGGEASNSAIVLSRLGLKTKLDGNWINPKNVEKINTLLKPYNIDISRFTVKEGFGTEEIVITDKHTRTVFGNYAAFHSGKKQWNTPNEEDIVNTAFVGLDPYMKNEALLVAELCVKHEKPYVTLDCKYDSFVAQNSAAVVISHELRNEHYINDNQKDIFNKYLDNCKGLVIFTFGSDELWYGRHGQEIKKFKPFKIETLDTTGAGDSFRGAIIYGLFKGWSDEKIIEFASAVAACVCLTMPHALNAPNLTEVEKFITEQQLTQKD